MIDTPNFSGVNRRNFLRGSAMAGLCAAGGTGLAAQAQDAMPVSLPNSLDGLARSKGMRFGTALDQKDVADPAIASLIEHECSILVGENAFKWKHIEPRARKYRFDDADRIAAYANAHNMALRGHTLVWNQDNRVPGWLAKVEEEAEAVRAPVLEALIAKHIEVMMGRYPGIGSWDVVNEMIEVGTGEVRSSVISRVLGERVMDFAFAKARELSPGTELVYNDYMTWNSKPDHRDGVLRLLEGALSRDVPIDALGIQSHLVNTLDGDIDEKAWRMFMDEVQGMGLKVVLTELDCADMDAGGDVQARDKKVAAHTKAYLDLTLSYPNVTDILLWDMTDRDSYVRSDVYNGKRARDDGKPLRAHPYNDDLQPKPMRWAIAQALQNAPDRRKPVGTS